MFIGFPLGNPPCWMEKPPKKTSCEVKGVLSRINEVPVVKCLTGAGATRGPQRSQGKIWKDPI